MLRDEGLGCKHCILRGFSKEGPPGYVESGAEIRGSL